ncbi:hypothetical protein [Telmatospirillum sp. J64-1]|uniref:hypothetical protein n=1 Tax=Telmatospirillum sp. J64-1 TaxID=2502183 RepID=UPI00163D6DB0|nr:hypothetical protein [Telmatospirillum sp. J64-1]
MGFIEDELQKTQSQDQAGLLSDGKWTPRTRLLFAIGAATGAWALVVLLAVYVSNLF